MQGKQAPTPSVVRPAKPVRLDGITKERVLAINNHLKEKSIVEHAGHTQLVNDKKLSKELASQLPSLAASLSEQGSLETDAILQARSSSSTLAYTESAPFEPTYTAKVHAGHTAEAYNQVSLDAVDDNNEQATESLLGRKSRAPRNPPLPEYLPHKEPKRQSKHSDDRIAGGGKTVYPETLREPNALESDQAASLRRSASHSKAVNSTQNTRGQSIRKSKSDHHHRYEPAPTHYGLNHRHDDPILNMRSESSDSQCPPKSVPDAAENKTHSYPQQKVHRSTQESPTAQASETGTGEIDEITGLEVTLGQFESKVSRSNVSTPSSSSDTPWGPMSLKPSAATSITGASMSSGSQPEWAHLKLRRVERHSPTSYKLQKQVSTMSTDEASTTLSEQMASFEKEIESTVEKVSNAASADSSTSTSLSEKLHQISLGSILKAPSNDSGQMQVASVGSSLESEDTPGQQVNSGDTDDSNRGSQVTVKSAQSKVRNSGPVESNASKAVFSAQGLGDSANGPEKNLAEKHDDSQSVIYEGTTNESSAAKSSSEPKKIIAVSNKDAKDIAYNDGDDTLSHPHIIKIPSDLQEEHPPIIQIPDHYPDDFGQNSGSYSNPIMISESAPCNRNEIIRIALIHELGVAADEVAHVSIGPEDLTATKAAPGNDVATQLWKIPRHTIESLSLEMATMQVRLLVRHGPNMTLSFGSFEHCLLFANSYYGATKRDEPRRRDSNAQPTPVTSIDTSVNAVEVDESLNGSLLMELNEEEQNVLETYRRLRREKGQQDALQSLSFDTTVVGKADDRTESTLTLAEDLFAAKLTRKSSRELCAPGNILKQDDIARKISTLIMSQSQSGRSQPPSVVGTNEQLLSPVSAMSASVALSLEEAQLVENYKKMLRLNIEPEALRHQMRKDQVDGKIMARVFSADEIPAIPRVGVERLTDEEKLQVESFQKMLKLNFPLEVVRHRMKKEQVNSKVVEAVLGSQSEEGKANDLTDDQRNPTKLTEEEEHIASKYRKMLNMKIESAAVLHKMTKEQVDPKIINAVLGHEIDDVKRQAIDQVPSKKKIVSALSDEEESVASSYRKMLRLQIPKDKVLSRMKQDGVSEKIISSVVGNQIKKTSSKDESKDGSNTGSKLVSLHWTPLSGKELDNSVWRATSKLEVIEAQPEGRDISKLIALFQKKTTFTKASKMIEVDESNTKEKAKLLDITRSNNVSISLKAFKDFSQRELAEIIAFIDPLHKIRGERVQFMKGLLPTAPEIKSIQEYAGPDERLVPAEIWFRRICNIPRIDGKVQVMQTMETFQSEANSLSQNFKLLSEVCNQVMDSDKLQILLGMVLRIGNIMNEGTRTGGAAGFKFDSLLRLTQTKSSDGKMTVLDFLVAVFVEKGQRQTLDLQSDFPECNNASRMAIGDLLGGVKEIKEALICCQEELISLKDEAAQSIQEPSWTHNNDRDRATQTTSLPKRIDFIATMKERPNKDTEPIGGPIHCGQIEPCDSAVFDSSNGRDFERNTLQGGIVRLEKFLKEATKTCSMLDESRKEALDACRDLSQYCGESGGTNATSTLLGILAQFATNLHEALKKYDSKLEAERRRQRKRSEEHSHASSDDASKSSVTSSEAHAANNKSLVLLVSDMLKDANERTKEDFRKGRIYPNPSDKLKAIYEREQAKCFSSPNMSRRKLDIVSAIREQEDSIDQAEVLKARRQFAGNYCSATPDSSTSCSTSSVPSETGKATLSPVPEVQESPLNDISRVRQARSLFQSMDRRDSSVPKPNHYPFASRNAEIKKAGNVSLGATTTNTVTPSNRSEKDISQGQNVDKAAEHDVVRTCDIGEVAHAASFPCHLATDKSVHDERLSDLVNPLKDTVTSPQAKSNTPKEYVVGNGQENDVLDQKLQLQEDTLQSGIALPSSADGTSSSCHISDTGSPLTKEEFISPAKRRESVTFSDARKARYMLERIVKKPSPARLLTQGRDNFRADDTILVTSSLETSRIETAGECGDCLEIKSPDKSAPQTGSTNRNSSSSLVGMRSKNLSEGESAETSNPKERKSLIQLAQERRSERGAKVKQQSVIDLGTEPKIVEHQKESVFLHLARLRRESDTATGDHVLPNSRHSTGSVDPTPVVSIDYMEQKSVNIDESNVSKLARKRRHERKSTG